MDRAIYEVFPRLAGRLPIALVGELPTPIHDLAPVVMAAGARGFPAWVKRDDLTSPVYGGNKVRTLEMLFGEARERGATRIWSTGAYGSNHAAATVLHARRAGLEPGIVLFPQPDSATAAENLCLSVSSGASIVDMAHWSMLPFGMRRARRVGDARGERSVVMVPGGATPRGGIGYVSAALEVGRQIEAGEMSRPAVVIVGVGSTCTSAGLLVGFHHAAQLGIGFRDARGEPAPPLVVAVRVTPWPVTAAVRIARLAVRVSRELAELAGDPSLALPYSILRARLRVDGRFLGRGYGHSTREGIEAIELFRALPGLELDTTYTAKSGAALVRWAREGREGPALFWSTKSTAPVPSPDAIAIAAAPPRMRRYLERIEAANRPNAASA